MANNPVEEAIAKLSPKEKEYLNQFCRDIFKSCLNPDGSFSLYQLNEKIIAYHSIQGAENRNLRPDDNGNMITGAYADSLLATQFNQRFSSNIPTEFFRKNHQMLENICYNIKEDTKETVEYQEAIDYVSDPENAGVDKKDVEKYLAENSTEFINRIETYRKMAGTKEGENPPTYFTERTTDNLKKSPVEHKEHLSSIPPMQKLQTSRTAREPQKPDPLDPPPKKPGRWSRFLKFFKIKNQEYKTYEAAQQLYEIQKTAYEDHMTEYKAQMKEYNQNKSYTNAIDKRKQLDEAERVRKEQERIKQEARKEQERIEEEARKEQERIKKEKEAKEIQEKTEEAENEEKEYHAAKLEQEELTKELEKAQKELANAMKEREKVADKIKNEELAEQKNKEYAAQQLGERPPEQTISQEEKAAIDRWAGGAESIRPKEHRAVDRKTAIAELAKKTFREINKMMANSGSKSQKMPMTFVAAVGMYQMIYDDKGNLKEDSYAKLQEIPGNMKTLIDTVSKNEWAKEDMQSCMTLGDFAKKLEKNEPIFLNSTQRDILDEYANNYKKVKGNVKKENGEVIKNEDNKLVKKPDDSQKGGIKL